MPRIKHTAVGLFFFTMTAGGVVLADCPHNLPTQLLEDCLIYNSEGESFPASDYAHMDQYQAWLKTQQPKSQPDTVTAPESKNMTAARKLIN
jgi:hypothetical protein